MSKDTVTVELTREEALAMEEQLRTDRMPEGSASAYGKLRAALAASERDERAERLGLPWSYAKGEDGWYVHFSKGNPRPHDYCEYEQARLMASAPDLAEALENLLEDSGDDVVRNEAVDALEKVGWR